MPFDLITFGASVLTAGGGAAVITWGGFKAFGGKWLDHRFSREIEAVRQAHVRETEGLRYKIAGLLDRTTKLNQREFDVLPDMWAKADEAHLATSALVSRWRSYPDIFRMSEAQFTEWLAGTPFADWQKDELRAKGPHDRNQYYSANIKWHELQRALNASREFSEAVSRGGIFVHPDTFRLLDELAVFIFQVARDWQIKAEFREQGTPVASEENDLSERYRREGDDRFVELRAHLQARYWSAVEPI